MFEPCADRIAAARSRQAQAFYLEAQARPPVAIFCNQFIAFGARLGTLPADYFENPEAMTHHQLAYQRARMERIEDDFVPYLLPQYGTGVLASAFGAEIVFPAHSDPAVAHPCITSLDDIDALELPDPTRDGLMPRVLDTIDCMRTYGELPVGLTDMQSTLATCCLLCGHSQLFTWMYDAPDKVHQLFGLVNRALLDWIIVQKQRIGEPLDTVYGQLLCLPKGCGVVLAEDDATAISARLYKEFCLPYNEQLFSVLGGGMLHFCGDATHQIPNYAVMEGLRGLHILPLGNLGVLERVQRALGDRMFLAAGEFLPFDTRAYYHELLSRLSPRGLILIPYVVETLRLADGGYVIADNDLLDAAQEAAGAIASFYDAPTANEGR